MVAKFTHTVRMDWMPRHFTGQGTAVAIIRFRDGKLAHEHIYWDQASVLVQLGLLDPGTLPVVGIDSARKLVNPNLPQMHSLIATQCRASKYKVAQQQERS